MALRSIQSAGRPNMAFCCSVLLLFLPSTTSATVIVQDRHYPSMPAVFGASLRPGVIYHARLQTVPENPEMCPPKDQDWTIQPPRHQEQRHTSRQGHLLRALRGHEEHDKQESPRGLLRATQMVGMEMMNMMNPQYSNDPNSPIVTPPDGLPVALLVRRGDCSFEDKARMSMALSNVIQYVIVYDDRAHSQLVPMSAEDPSGIHVAMLFIPNAAGVELTQMIANQPANVTDAGGMLVRIDSKLPLWPLGPNYQDEQQWMLAALAGFFTFLSCFGCLLVCILAGYIPSDGRIMIGGRTIATAPRMMSGSSRLLTPEQVALFPEEEYTEQDDTDEDRACAICIEEYEPGEMLRVLPCCHKFHHECLVPWLCERSASCPLCKHDIVSPDEEQDDEEEEEAEFEFENNNDSSSGEHGDDHQDSHPHHAETRSPWGWRIFVSRSHRRRPVPTEEEESDEGRRNVPVARAESA